MRAMPVRLWPIALACVGIGAEAFSTVSSLGRLLSPGSASVRGQSLSLLSAVGPRAQGSRGARGAEGIGAGEFASSLRPNRERAARTRGGRGNPKRAGAEGQRAVRYDVEGLRAETVRVEISSLHDIYEPPKVAEKVRDEITLQMLSYGRVNEKELPSREELEMLNVFTLKDICCDLGLIQTGRKEEIIERIDQSRGSMTEAQVKKKRRTLLKDQLEAQARVGFDNPSLKF